MRVRKTLWVYIIIAISGLSMLIGAKLKELSIKAESDRINQQVLDSHYGR